MVTALFPGNAMFRMLLVVTILLVGAPAQAGVDLKAWDRLLRQAVSDGVVSYAHFRDNTNFDQLVAQVGSADTQTMNRDDKLVFYINAYNILAVRGILDGGSPSSLFGRYRYFKRDEYLVAGDEITLYGLEHELIRPLGEARIHFAIVCASQSCPILRSEAYTLDRLDQQLELAALEFINDTRRNRFDTKKGIATISSIFDWFEEDFAGAKGSLQGYLAAYVSDPAVAAMLRDGEFRIKHQKYDWRLNGTL